MQQVFNRCLRLWMLTTMSCRTVSPVCYCGMWTRTATSLSIHGYTTHMHARIHTQHMHAHTCTLRDIIRMLNILVLAMIYFNTVHHTVFTLYHPLWKSHDTKWPTWIGKHHLKVQHCSHGAIELIFKYCVFSKKT